MTFSCLATYTVTVVLWIVFVVTSAALEQNKDRDRSASARRKKKTCLWLAVISTVLSGLLSLQSYVFNVLEPYIIATPDENGGRKLSISIGCDNQFCCIFYSVNPRNCETDTVYQEKFTIEKTSTVVARTRFLWLFESAPVSALYIIDDVGGNEGYVYVEKIVLDRDTDSLEKGQQCLISACVSPENASDAQDLLWYSEDKSIARVDNGLVTAVAPGTTVIYAMDRARHAPPAECEITVTQSEAVAPVSTKKPQAAGKLVSVTEICLIDPPERLNLGDTVIFRAEVSPSNATDTAVSWSTDNAAVAAVDPANGQVTVTGTGFVKITATASNGLTASKDYIVQTLKFNVKQACLEAGNSLFLQIEQDPYVGPLDVVWRSSDINVAVVDQNGRIFACGTGTCNITAVVNGITLACFLTVKESRPEAVEIFDLPSTFLVGDSYWPNADVYPLNVEQDVIWESRDPDVIAVNGTGRLIALSPGRTVLYAHAKADWSVFDSCVVRVEAPWPEEVELELLPQTMLVGEHYWAEAWAYPSEASQDMVWYSSDPDILYVDEDGYLSALSPGRAVIYVQSQLDADCWDCQTVWVEA